MPTQDRGKPTSRKRTSGTGAVGRDAESTRPSRGARKRTAASDEQPAPTPSLPASPAAPTSSTAPAVNESAAPRPRSSRRRTSQPPAAAPAEGASSAVPLEPVADVSGEQPQGAAEPGEPAAPAAPGEAAEEEAETEGLGREPGVPLVEALPGEDGPRRRERRGAGTNALGVFIERQFANPTSPAHSYSDLERHSGISREALSRYVTARRDRRRSPTIDTLVAIADALHVSLEAVARAAAASVRGVIPPPEEVQHAREEALGALVAVLTDEQFNAVMELLRQMRPPIS